MKKIYVKINDTFTEYEDTQQIRQGLHLDKQIAEQAGGDFQIFEPEQLSDEDKLFLGLTTEAEFTEKERTNKLNEIVSSFNEQLANGYFLSTALGIEVDCRRSGIKNDLQNVQGLISFLERRGGTETHYVGYSETVLATVDQLKTLCTEMEDHVLRLYEQKWQLEELVKLAETRDQIKNIVIEW
jgi:hypothetical protein